MTKLIQELKALPEVNLEGFQNPKGTLSTSIEVSLVIPAKNSFETLQNTVSQAHRYLSDRFGQGFEIILVPNPVSGMGDPAVEVAQSIAANHPGVRVVPHQSPPGKGAAVRTGVLASHGKWIFLTDADLPYDLDFFDRALPLLKEGIDLVTGNRRLPESHFQIPVSLLPVAYGRHRLGLAYNRLVRTLLPIRTTDTQAGIKALSRSLAFHAFTQMACPGFLYDLEIFLSALGQGLRQTELPVTLYLRSEKSTVRILRECLLVGCWLSRITWRNFRKKYGAYSMKKQKVLRRYQGAGLSTQLFLTARWKLTPYSKMASHLPNKGKILDLGCGHGLFALAAGLNSPHREILGIDHDQKRVSLATQATSDLNNIRLQAGNMASPPIKEKAFSGVSMIDVMHYFDPKTQEALLAQVFNLLESGGTLIVREVDPHGGLPSVWNRFYERIATWIGFTQSKEKNLYFRSRPGWEGLLKKTGFEVKSERCSSFLFADILYICERPREETTTA